MNNIVVIGGRGLIGHNVAKILDAVDIIDNHDKYGTQTPPRYSLRPMPKMASMFCRHISDESCSHLLTQSKYDTVIMLASYPRQALVSKNPLVATNTMITGLVNVLEACAKSVKRFVFISSSMVYGNFVGQARETDPLTPIGTYGIMKLAGEQIVKDYAERFGFEYVIIRPSAVYGPTDCDDRVITRFFMAAAAGEELQVNGINEKLDFTYVSDIAHGIALATVSQPAANQTFNMTYGTAVSILEAANNVIELVGDGTIRVADAQPHFPSRGALDCSHAKELIGYAPEVDLKTGLSRYYNWLTINNHL